MPATSQLDYTVTPDEISELVRRIVADTNPLAVIAFGSRARGDNKDTSDLDVAIIVENEHAGREHLGNVAAGIRIGVDLLVIGKERFDRFRPWINTVQQQIDREGVRLYERGGQPATRTAFQRLCSRRTNASV